MPQIDMERNREDVTRENIISSLEVRTVSTVSSYKKIIMIIIIIELKINNIQM